MGSQYAAQTRSLIFWDPTAAGNPIGKYSCVSIATDAQVATANAAGIQGGSGDICVPTPIAANVPTSMVYGVAEYTQRVGQAVNVVVGGTVWCIAQAAITVGQIVQPVLSELRTQLQTPINGWDQYLIPGSPEISRNYILVECAPMAIAPAAGATANAEYFPLGVALESTTVGQYDLIRVDLSMVPRIMYA